MTSLWARAAFLPLVLLLASWGCAHSTWEAIDLATVPGHAEYPDANQGVLLEEQIVQFKIDGETGKAVTDTTFRRRRRFLTPDAARPSRVSTEYNRAFSKVLSFRGRVIRPDGTSEELDASRRIDAPAYTSNLLDDVRVVTLPVPTLAPGSILEEEQVIRTTELNLSPVVWRAGRWRVAPPSTT